MLPVLFIYLHDNNEVPAWPEIQKFNGKIALGNFVFIYYKNTTRQTVGLSRLLQKHPWQLGWSHWCRQTQTANICKPSPI